MRRTFIITISFTLSIIFITGAFAFAGSEQIKARMKQRLPVINDLKNRGIIGENNKGYLDFIGGNKEKADVVNAENRDRKKVYTALGKQENLRD